MGLKGKEYSFDSESINLAVSVSSELLEFCIFKIAIFYSIILPVFGSSAQCNSSLSITLCSVSCLVIPCGVVLIIINILVVSDTKVSSCLIDDKIAGSIYTKL